MHAFSSYAILNIKYNRRYLQRSVLMGTSKKNIKRSHILAKLCRRINQPTGFVLHLMFTQKILLRFKKITFQVVLFLVGNVGAKCPHITSHFRHNESSDQPFPITFSKNGKDIYIQKVVFLANFERIFEKFQSVAKL